MNCIIHIDGGARGNPGPAAVGVVILDAETDEPLHEAGYFIGTATNNVAEYRALLRALELAGELGANGVQVRSDSELLVKQVNGEYRVKAPHLRSLHRQATEALRRWKNWNVVHVRREQNRRADELANRAIDAKGDIDPGDASDPAAADGSLPCWTAELSGRNGKCLAGTGTGNPYTFGPTTPDGFCIHAAAAVLADGPIQWGVNKRNGKTGCRRCGLQIKVMRLV